MVKTLVVSSLLVVVAAGGASAQFAGPLSAPPPGKAATDRLPILKDVGIDQKLDGSVPMDLAFVDENGHDVKLGDYFGHRPVVLALVYYQCPMLCTLVLNGLVGSIEGMNFTAGQEYDVVAVSFDPSETPTLAANKKAAYLTRYGRPGAEAGFHFLTGRPESIRALTSAVGFRYAYDPTIQQFAHPAAITVLTPAGRISRYLYGIEFAPRDVRLALVEAADGRIGTVVDQALLYCYHYDPLSGRYATTIMNVIRIGGVLTLAVLGTFVVTALRRERRPAAAVDAGQPTATGIR
jgi:protein SCO1/2